MKGRVELMPRRILRALDRFRVAPDTLLGPVDGAGTGELVCILRRCMYGTVEVVGARCHPEGVKAIAGARPRDEAEPWRERMVKVRLVREPTNPDDPDAIAVFADAGNLVGHVRRSSARRMAPAIDTFLRSLAAKREFRGCALDLYCTAMVSAEWVDLADVDRGEDEQEPSVLDVILLVDDGDLGFKISGRDIAVHW
jgi:hypothetical protein